MTELNDAMEEIQHVKVLTSQTPVNGGGPDELSSTTTTLWSECSAILSPQRCNAQTFNRTAILTAPYSSF
ncbi:hypothetical protein LguiA_002835 [Lonicera macranthoides]